MDIPNSATASLPSLEASSLASTTCKRRRSISTGVALAVTASSKLMVDINKWHILMAATRLRTRPATETARRPRH